MAVLADPEPLVVDPPKEVNTGGPGGGGPGDFEPGGHGGGGGDDDEGAWRKRSGGPSLAMIGLLTALFSITALFTALVIAYMARSRTRIFWQPITLPSALWVSTFVISLSSASLEMARSGFRQMSAQKYSRWLKVTAGLGAAFVLSQALAFQRLAGQGVFMRQNPRSALLYIVTVTHGLHLIGGLGALSYLIWRTSRLPSLRVEYRSHKNVLAVSGVYWHFLVALWMALFGILLFWK